MLYTVMPLDVIFQEEEEGGYRELELGGVQLQVEETSPGWGTIARVISTDPRAFLDPRFQPGVRVQI
jgi:hypothetical protein